MSSWLLPLVLACLGRRPAPFDPTTEPRSPERAVAQGTGMVQDGLFMDGRYPFWLSVPPGWRARPGPEGGALRVRLRHPATGTRVEVWSFEGTDLYPRPRPGCLWTFESTGRYKALRVSGDVLTATCMPDDPLDARVIAYMLVRAGRAWQIEAHIPGDRLVQGVHLADEIIESARWSRE